ncbi:Protein of unknown function [Pyronema omphalodes CBS 100304]|uniref:Uncharacterized protein n=1 Tax=Pyronema omphalodes (strain CBS 100304) TaxID=1076935 RepID=U4LXH1_PYROM|nr:Protein of unknown function [Pyronema omphalodes CBS 100304]
MLSSWFVPD